MDEECPICLESLNDDTLQLQCCKKIFHLPCIVKCLSHKMECPMCRHQHEYIITKVVDMKLVHVYRNQDFFRNTFIASVLVTGGILWWDFCC